VVLTLEGYNNSAVFQNEGTPDTPLPGTLDIILKDCLNYTIGAAVPMIGGADVLAAPSASVIQQLYCPEAASGSPQGAERPSTVA
ncbi:hypothetical protein MPER_08691, partial [Moniliophthora perniciosa FA553]